MVKGNTEKGGETNGKEGEAVEGLVLVKVKKARRMA